MNSTFTIKDEGSKNMGNVSSFIRTRDNNRPDYSLRKMEEGTHPIPIPFFLPQKLMDVFEGVFNVTSTLYD